MKRATRYRVEVVDKQGVVLWEVLVHNMPDQRLTNVLRSFGYIVRPVNPRNQVGPLPLTYSDLDPETSIRAAREYASRRDTHLGNALVLLIDHAPYWVSRDQVRKVAGDQGDRRVRELRQRGWPVEIRQLHPGEAWHVRMLLPGTEHNLPEPDASKLF